MKRLFFALWPDADTRRQCHQLCLSLGDFGKPVAANNLHVTLVFLGSIDAAVQSAITQAADALPVQPMQLRFDRLSYWKKPAVVCLCATQTDPAVSNLAAHLTQRAAQQGIALDQRPYRPHVTLVRKAKNLPPATVEPIVWRAQGFCLLESVSTPLGVKYQVLERWGVVA